MNKDDGGPAFPAPDAAKARFGDSNPDAFLGMSLRDYFAAKADIRDDFDSDGCIDQRLAVALMDGETPPNWDNDYLEARVWWAKAESRLRYMKADAMIAARSA